MSDILPGLSSLSYILCCQPSFYLVEIKYNTNLKFGVVNHFIKKRLNSTKFRTNLTIQVVLNELEPNWVPTLFFAIFCPSKALCFLSVHRGVFCSFLSGGFTTMAVINPPEKKTGKTHLCALYWVSKKDYNSMKGHPTWVQNPHSLKS